MKKIIRWIFELIIFIAACAGMFLAIVIQTFVEWIEIDELSFRESFRKARKEWIQ